MCFLWLTLSHMNGHVTGCRSNAASAACSTDRAVRCHLLT
jgi:hypothetical protein